MKSLILISLAALLVSGCSTGVVSAGKDTYMVHKGGWPSMNGFACEAKCYEAANRYCANHKLAIASS